MIDLHSSNSAFVQEDAFEMLADLVFCYPPLQIQVIYYRTLVQLSQTCQGEPIEGQTTMTMSVSVKQTCFTLFTGRDISHLSLSANTLQYVGKLRIGSDITYCYASRIFFNVSPVLLACQFM